MKNLRLVLHVFLFLSMLVLTILIFRGEQRNRVIKEGLIELNLIKYGLFSVDEWKHIAASLVAGKIEGLELSGENKAAMRQRISSFLYEVIEDFETRFYEERSRSLKGIIQSGVASFTGTFGKLKQDVPIITDQIIAFLDNPQSKKALRSYLYEQLDQYTVQTFSQIDYTRHDRVLQKYGYENRHDALVGINAEIARLESKNQPYKITLIMLVVLTAFFIAWIMNPLKAEFMVFLGICVLLLIPGILLPMIEIDARISELAFSLLGEPISFQNQVLFYQSKSILEVVEIMFQQRGADLILVGILILAFSVIFPAAKLLATVLFIYSPKLESHKFIRLLVFRTGKWSMADVMVIAIFMAYIGFNGIISGQLSQIESLAIGVDVLTTNESGILSGFWFFTAFVILSLIVSQKLHSNKIILEQE